MTPSYVRSRILQDHAALREDLSALEASVVAMYDDRAHCRCVVALAREILNSLVLHTQLEDAILAPALRDLDAWGPVRAELLLEHHASQRTQLREIVDTYSAFDEPERVARTTLDWIREVRADMLHEESDVLSAALLKDDPISVAMETG